MKLTKIKIQRYRSIKKLELSFQDNLPIIICGANNVGKTNFLRALGLFFSLDINNFKKERDLPEDIIKGSGSNPNTRITGYFEDNKKVKYQITTVFKKERGKGNVLVVSGKKGKNKISESEAKEIIKKFRFLFIEAGNINIPKVIDEIIDEEVLPFGLQRKVGKEVEALKKFKEFIKTSQRTLEKITKDIEKIFNEFITDIDGIDSTDWKMKILFSEYERLREALSGIIDFTLYDKNDKEIESKGSGIQRIVLLSLMKYVSEKTKKKIIWGIDEPEAFLQPTLQKRTFKIIREISKKQQCFITSHSPNSIDIENVNNIFLFEANHELKTYARTNEAVYQTQTFYDKNLSEYEKIQKIKKHLGIETNDSWNILKYNILVEGEDDKQYITALSKKFGSETPNILVAGGTSKIKGYLQFLKEFCSDLTFKPKIRIIVDHDYDGKAEYESISTLIKKNKYKDLDLSIEYIPRCDGKSDKSLDYEIEDFIYPELIRDATNKFLKTKKYKSILKKDFLSRFKEANNKKCILNFITTKVKINNEDKEEINFENNNGIKLILCKKICDYIKNHDIESMNNEYPKVKEYIEDLCKK